MIGTNALESFNGSIAALVTKKSDFYTSHVGRAMLAILKRCFPGGYVALVELLRGRLELAPLTNEAKDAATPNIKRANHIGANETVCSEAKLQGLNLKKRERRADASKAAKANAVALKKASAAQLFFPGRTPEASNPGGAAGSTRQVPGEVSFYDASGSKHKRTEKEFTATMEPPRKKKRLSGKCKGCLAAGVPDAFLVAWNHERKLNKKCREVQESWKREQAAASTNATVVVAAAMAETKRPRAAAGEETKAAVGDTVAAHANAPRGSAGRQTTTPNCVMAASQVKRPRGTHGEQAKETKGAAATAQATQASGSATVPRECMPSEAADVSSLSRSGRVRKRKILADM
jgi:hypothetical protein